VIVTDGVFSADADDTAVFHPALLLDQDDYLSVQQKMRHRSLRWLLRHGHLDSAAVHTLDAPDHAGGWSVDALVTLPAWKHIPGREAERNPSRATQRSFAGGPFREYSCISMPRLQIDSLDKN